MANQPTRPWFRLASLARPPASVPSQAQAQATAPAPATEPRPAVARPTFRPLAPSLPIQAQEPTSPPAATAPPPTAAPPLVATSASVPSSPTPRASAPSASVPSSPTPRASAPSASVPSSPTPRASAPSASVQTSPVQKATIFLPSSVAAPPSAPVQTFPIATRAAAAAAAARVPSPIPPPKTFVPPAAETPPQSSKSRPTAPPPSPLILPPSQMKSTETEPEQKTVLVQKTIEKPKPWLGGHNGGDQTNYNKPSIIRNGVEQDVESKEKEKGNHHRKKVSDNSEEMRMRVITIAGENKGAFMELIHSPQKHHNKKGNGGKTQSHGSDSESYNTSSDKEGNQKSQKGKAKTSSSLPMNAFMNSNVQGVNNSILYNASCTHHDPGVHLALSRKPSGEFQVKDRVNNGGGHN
ncbi:vegetative cell wall protein gp1 [Corylus avellana]|uniref:vegetative cell wall protein gp1 n=1 Tax=Corylus avellana TaxID=13451 RepID=UPI00286C8830|nr:vegetative cell wall protein gp1 [Corylus avellana]